MPVGNEQPDRESWENETFFAVKNLAKRFPGIAVGKTCLTESEVKSRNKLNKKRKKN